MSYLNINIPPIECFVRAEFLRNLEDSHGKMHPCLIFGMSSIPSKVPLFHFLMEDGGIWWRMPIHAFASRQDAKPLPLEELVLWDSFSYYPTVTKFQVLENKKMKYISRSKNEYFGRYLFTLDWAHENRSETDQGFSEAPGQHKCGHVIELDNGNYAIQPNNRIRVYDPSFCTKANTTVIQRKLNSFVWTVEDNPKWMTSDDDRYEYEIRDTESD